MCFVLKKYFFEPNYFLGGTSRWNICLGESKSVKRLNKTRTLSGKNFQSDLTNSGVEEDKIGGLTARGDGSFHDKTRVRLH